MWGAPSWLPCPNRLCPSLGKGRHQFQRRGKRGQDTGRADRRTGHNSSTQAAARGSHSTPTVSRGPSSDLLHLSQRPPRFPPWDGSGYARGGGGPLSSDVTQL